MLWGHYFPFMESQPQDFKNDEKTDFIPPCIFLTAAIVFGIQSKLVAGSSAAHAARAPCRLPCAPNALASSACLS